MKIAILQANLGNFDDPKDPVEQKFPHDDQLGLVDCTFHRWTDENFPPVTGLTPRLQYRIPKLFGWEMLPGYDYYIWLDGGISFLRDDCALWYLDQLGDNDIALFKHPRRRNIRQEVKHIDDHLKAGKPYISARYKNGLHQEQSDIILKDTGYKDRSLYASTTFIYRNTQQVQDFLKDWWYYQSRYFTCDQVPLPWLLWKHKLKVKTFDEPIFQTGYMSLVSHHK